DRGPLGLVGRKFDGDPVEGLAIQFVQRGVELCGVVICALRHALPESGAGVVAEPEIGTAAFAGKMAAADEQHTRARAVMPLVLAGGAMGVFELLLRGGVLLVLLSLFNERHAGAEDFQAIGRYGNHCGFEADFAGAAIEEKWRVVTKGFADMLRRGGRKLCEAVGAGRG